MSKYSDLMAQAKALMAEAERVQAEGKVANVAEVKAKMQEYGLTLEDLGGKSGGKSIGKAKKNDGVRAEKGPKAAPKYKGPNGELWSGGPGRRPGWVTEITTSGGNIEQYRIPA